MYLLEDYRKTGRWKIHEYELYRIANPNVYLIENVLRKKGNDICMKWLGFDNSHNSRIHKDNVLYVNVFLYIYYICKQVNEIFLLKIIWTYIIWTYKNEFIITNT